MANVLSPQALLLLLSVWLFALDLSAQPKQFVIGVEDQLYYPHYQYKDGNFSGFAREVLEEFARYKGFKFSYKPYTANNLFQALISREIDFKYPDNPYWQHQQKEGVRIGYSDPVAPYIDGVSVLSENLYKGVGQLKILGTISGFTPFNYEYLIKTGKITLVEIDSTQDLIKALVENKVDGIYANVDVIAYQFNQIFAGEKNIQFDKSLPYTYQSYMLSTTKHPRLLMDFNDFLTIKSEKINQLKKQFNIKDIDNY